MSESHPPAGPLPSSVANPQPHAAPAPLVIPPPTWGSRIASVLMMVMVAVLVLAGMAFSGMLPMGWLLGETEAGTVTQQTKLKVDLVEGKEATLRVPREVREALGLRKGGKENVYPAHWPENGIPLVLPGSTALDTTRLLRVRARFAPAEVVRLGTRNEQVMGKSVPRGLRSGDTVEQNELLGVFYSVDVGSKKNDLYDALVQMKLDKEILDRAEAGRASVPEIFILNARRAVLGDRNAINRAENMLRAWNIPLDDIEAVYKEAERADLEGVKAAREKKKSRNSAEEKEAKQKQLDQWARVELRAPYAATIIERNVAEHETVVDGTTNLFVLARVDRLAVIANAPEDDLEILEQLKKEQRLWTISTVGVPADKKITGAIDEIGYYIDPQQHTLVVKWHIDNQEKLLRGGQFVSASITLEPPKDVVQIPMSAIVDDGKQCVVFVQPKKDKPEFVLRRVLLTHRFDKMAFVRSTVTPHEQELKKEEKEDGLRVPQPLQPGERVITAGVLELKKELEDREAAALEQKKKDKEAQGEKG